MKKEFDRFYGVTEEELYDKRLDDVIDYNLDIVFVNINPGLYSVYKGHHYSGPGNHFWRCISESGLTNHVLKSSEDYKMLDYRMGLVNMFEKYNKKSCQDMSVEEIKEAQANLDKKIKLYKPKIVAFNGKSIYEIYMGASANNKDFNFGKQPTRFANGTTDTFMFVMPSSSARCSQLPRIIDKVPFYTALKKLKDFLRGYLSELNDLDVTFPDFKVALDSGADTSELKKGYDSDSNENDSDDPNSTPTNPNAHRIKFVRLNNLPYSQIPNDILENLRAQRTSKKSVTITTTKDYFKSASRAKVEEKRFAGSSACSDLDSVSTATNDSSDYAELDQQQASATSKIGSLILNICSNGKPEAKTAKLNSPVAHSPQIQPKPVSICPTPQQIQQTAPVQPVIVPNPNVSTNNLNKYVLVNNLIKQDKSATNSELCKRLSQPIVLKAVPSPSVVNKSEERERCDGVLFELVRTDRYRYGDYYVFETVNVAQPVVVSEEYNAALNSELERAIKLRYGDERCQSVYESNKRFCSSIDEASVYLFNSSLSNGCFYKRQCRVDLSKL